MVTRAQYWADPEYHRAKSREHYARHREYHIQYAREHRRNDPTIDRINHLKTVYGLTLSGYESLVEKQENKCALCGGERCGPGKRWHIDHDHSSGKIRGLLCSRCNTGLGLFDHSPERLQMAIDYLAKQQEEEKPV